MYVYSKIYNTMKGKYNNDDVHLQIKNSPVYISLESMLLSPNLLKVQGYSAKKTGTYRRLKP